MQEKKITYAQLLETNNLIQQLSDESYWLCFTRTVQESKLFPVSPYILLSYLMAFYRYPELLRKIENKLRAEEIGDRVRNSGVKLQNSAMSWCLPAFYLLGREFLINLGMLRPQDALDDIVYVMDFWKRYMLSWRREDAHLANWQFGHRCQVLPERRLQVFHADIYDCHVGDPLHHAVQAFLATISQYSFLVACESRICITNTGPYKVGENREMIIRDFTDLSESDYPWLDDIGNEIPYNNLTVVTVLEGCKVKIMDDWGSFETEPEIQPQNLAGIGLYTSDYLTEGFIPLGMNSREELTRTFTDLTEKIKHATAQLWKRIASWSRDQMLEAGAVTYFSAIKGLAHIAGVYEMEDWIYVDERADRFRPLLNDEYGNACLGELVGYLSMPSQSLNEYTMMQHSDAPTRMLSLIPYSVLHDNDYVSTIGPLKPGISSLPLKNDRYSTSCGLLTQEEYNRECSHFKPEYVNDKYRYLCDTWVKYHYKSSVADELYKLEQQNSRTLAGRGAGLLQADIETLREE